MSIGLIALFVAGSLAFRPQLQSLLAGVLLRASSGIRPGQHIECAGNVGQLESIGLLTTRLRGSSGEFIRLPNLFLMQRPVVLAKNVTADRTSGSFEGAGDTTASVWRHDGDTLHVRLRERGGGGAVVEVSWNAGLGTEHELHVRDHVLRAICTGLHQAGISVGRPNWEKHARAPGRRLH
jgi:small conductance mechanosensitive channel